MRSLLGPNVLFRRTQHTQTGQTFGTEDVCIPFQLTDSLGGSRASSNSGLKKLGGPGAGLGRWAKSWKAEKAAKLIVAEVETR